MIAPRTAPRLLLGITSLEGPTRATRDRQLEVAARFREPESLAVTLVKALDAGASAVWTGPSPALRAALEDLKRPVPAVARLPLTPAEEDLHDLPFLAAAPPATGGRTGPWPVESSPLAVLDPGLGDLATMVSRRIERELPALGPAVVEGLGVSASATDLALAAGNRRFFERLLTFGRGRVKGPVGFETANLGLLLGRFAEWGIAPDFVVGPVNPAGLALKPSPETVLAELATTKLPVIACELRAGGLVSLAEGAAFARAQGAAGLLAELVDLDDVREELRALRQG